MITFNMYSDVIKSVKLSMKIDKKLALPIRHDLTYCDRLCYNMERANCLISKSISDGRDTDISTVSQNSYKKKQKSRVK